jgi:hypothetical protein
MQVPADSGIERLCGANAHFHQWCMDVYSLTVMLHYPLCGVNAEILPFFYILQFPERKYCLLLLAAFSFTLWNLGVFALYDWDLCLTRGWRSHLTRWHLTLISDTNSTVNHEVGVEKTTSRNIISEIIYVWFSCNQCPGKKHVKP